jgi:general secretion pathway protein G
VKAASLSCFVFTAGIFLLGSGHRSMTAKTRIAMLESALAAFDMDNGRYPTTEEGLAALVEVPPALQGSSAYPAGGYLREQRVPDDPWGHAFLYRIPGQHNPEGFDLWSPGADGAPGGEGIDADVGNWPGGFAQHEGWHRREALLSALWFGTLVGGVLGAPIYLFGLISAALGRRSWRSGLIGAPFATLVYLIVACALASLLVPATID